MSLKIYKENFNEEVTNFIVSKLKESGVNRGQIRVQIIDAESELVATKEDIVDEIPVIISTGSGIMFATKKNF
jgi:hypothetical protein